MGEGDRRRGVSMRGLWLWMVGNQLDINGSTMVAAGTHRVRCGPRPDHMASPAHAAGSACACVRRQYIPILTRSLCCTNGA